MVLKAHEVPESGLFSQRIKSPGFVAGFFNQVSISRPGPVKGGPRYTGNRSVPRRRSPPGGKVGGMRRGACSSVRQSSQNALTVFWSWVRAFPAKQWVRACTWRQLPSRVQPQVAGRPCANSAGPGADLRRSFTADSRAAFDFCRPDRRCPSTSKAAGSPGCRVKAPAWIVPRRGVCRSQRR